MNKLKYKLKYHQVKACPLVSLKRFKLQIYDIVRVLWLWSTQAVSFVLLQKKQSDFQILIGMSTSYKRQ